MKINCESESKRASVYYYLQGLIVFVEAPGFFLSQNSWILPSLRPKVINLTPIIILFGFNIVGGVETSGNVMLKQSSRDSTRWLPQVIAPHYQGNHQLVKHYKAQTIFSLKLIVASMSTI